MICDRQIRVPPLLAPLALLDREASWNDQGVSPVQLGIARLFAIDRSPSQTSADVFEGQRLSGARESPWG